MQPVKTQSELSASFLALNDGRQLAYRLREGASPGVVFLGGFKSDMTGTKAAALDAYCSEQGRRCLRFDYSGHGESSGAFHEGTIGAWLRDTLDVLDRLAPEPHVWVGSSMGAWLMLLAALRRPGRAQALIGIASAPDFTERLVWEAFDPAQKRQLLEEGQVLIPDCYGAAPYPITRALVEDGRNYLLLQDKIDISCPVRLLHGMQDQDVPWRMSVALMERLAAADVRLQLVKGGDHRLSQPDHIALLTNTLREVLAQR